MLYFESIGLGSVVISVNKHQVGGKVLPSSGLINQIQLEIYCRTISNYYEGSKLKLASARGGIVSDAVRVCCKVKATLLVQIQSALSC